MLLSIHRHTETHGSLQTCTHAHPHTCCQHSCTHEHPHTTWSWLPPTLQASQLPCDPWCKEVNASRSQPQLGSWDSVSLFKSVPQQLSFSSPTSERDPSSLVPSPTLIPFSPCETGGICPQVQVGKLRPRGKKRVAQGRAVCAQAPGHWPLPGSLGHQTYLRKTQAGAGWHMLVAVPPQQPKASELRPQLGWWHFEGMSQ